MKVNSTEIQNNFGKYILEASKEDIVITKNGREVAILKSFNEEMKNEYDLQEEAHAYNVEKKRITYEEFLKIDSETEERLELIDGEIFILHSPKTKHQRVLSELHVLFYNFFKDKKCIPMLAPYDIRLKRHKKDMNVVQPDIMVICDLEEKLGDDDYYHGTPTLIVEILSKSTRRKDIIKKLDLYMCTGVTEYWIVDPISNEVHVYYFKDKDIESNRTYKENDTIKSFHFNGIQFEANDIFLYT